MNLRVDLAALDQRVTREVARLDQRIDSIDDGDGGSDDDGSICDSGDMSPCSGGDCGEGGGDLPDADVSPCSG